MSAGSYDTPHISNSFSRYDTRRPSGNSNTSYDRPIAPRRRTPSPGPSRRPYDSYVPERFEPSFRDTQPTVYRPNNYRPGSSGWVSRSPSPDHYEPPARLSDSDYWERTPSWRGPPPLEEWPDRKSIPPSPSTSSARGRSQRDDVIPPRSFEPSNSWKQTQADRFTRMDSFPVSDRYNDRRRRNSLDRSPDRPTRTDRASASNDRYRPSAKRESHPPGRSEYDSYRPHYDKHWSPPRRDPVSPSGSHNRRDSGSISYARTSDRFDTPPLPRYAPRKSTPSPVPVISPTHSPDSSRWTAPESDNAGWTYPASLDTSKRQVPPPRPPSRSSIASTQASVRKSPPLTETHSVVQPITPVAPATSIAAVNGAPMKENTTPKLDDIKSQPNNEVIDNAKNGNTLNSLTEGMTDDLYIPSVITKPATDVSLVSPMDSVKNTSELMRKSSPISSKGQVSKEIIAVDIAAKTPSNPTINGIHESPVISSATPVLTTALGDTLSKSPLPVPETSEAVKKGSRSQEPSLSIVRSSQPEMNDNSMDVDVELEEPPPEPLSTASPVPAKSAPSQTPIPTFHSRSLPKSDEIPPLSDAKSKADALRIVVMTRLLCDHQSREERIDPVLMANLSIASPPEVHPTSNPGMLLVKMSTGQPLIDRMTSFAATRRSLVMYLEQRHAVVSDKAARLREEYLSLHENWVAHCTALNEQQKTLASEHEMQHSGRTTRRSTANTDAVRSDFEMEQIIASLGNDDATDPNHLSMRNLAKVPDMISVVNGKVDYLFDDTADRVENPSEYFGSDTGITDWTEAEKKIYIDKFAAHPKQFGIIAGHLPNKSARQCVDYYYLHKKRLINFRKIVSQFAPNKRKRRGMGKKKGNGLLADIAMHDAEVHRDSGSTSASGVSRAPRGRKTLAPARPSSIRRNAVQFETPTSTPTPEPEARPRRRRILNSSTVSSNTSSFSTINAIAAVAHKFSLFGAGTVTPAVSATSAPSISAPPVASAAAEEEEEITELDPEPRPAKRPKRTRKIKSAATISDEHGSPVPDVPAATYSDLNANDSATRSKRAVPHTLQWSEEDKNMFLFHLAQYGDDFKRIAASMPNKTTIQVTNYYKSNLTELDLERVAATAPKRSPTPAQRESRKELSYPTSITLTSSTPVPVPASMPTAALPMLAPASAIFREPTGIPRQPTSAPTSTFPGRNVSAGKPLSSDGIIHSPPPPWSSPLPSNRPVSRISQPLSRPNHNATPNIRHPGYFAMDTRPEYPPDFPHEPRIPYGKPPDNVNLNRGPIDYGRSPESRQYLPATYSPPGISSNGRAYRPPGPSHGSSPIMAHQNAMPPLSQHVRTPYVYPPSGDHRNSIPIPSLHNPPGRSPHMYPPEHSSYVGFRPPLYEDGRSPGTRYPYPPIHPEPFQRSPPPFNAHSGPSLKRRLEPPYPDYPTTLVASPAGASTSASSSASNPNAARTPSRPPYPHYSEWD
ncbi:hypothetical protein BYT27DRAFT_7334313 [Phlegmacium glaucopus]|nr:hypothetical protein BYT27DRAFT_7334313 [Phlegmacium glaucopus]